MLKKGFLFTLVALFFLSASQGWAQETRTNVPIKRNVAQILFSTLGGAVLGLSTLSFYGEPQEHTNNISLGALLGFAAGTSYVLYKSANPSRPMETYDSYSNLSINEKTPVLAGAPVFIQFKFEY